MKKIISQIINGISIVTMAYFAIPKLLAMPESVAGFRQFESLVPIDADIFRVFTGLSEISMAILLLYFAISDKVKVGIATYLFLLTTMFTALGLEFFARPEPKTLLVVIAIVLVIFSVYQITSLKTRLNNSSN